MKEDSVEVLGEYVGSMDKAMERLVETRTADDSTTNIVRMITKTVKSEKKVEISEVKDSVAEFQKIIENALTK